MKKQKNTLCLFNLVFFLASFILVSFTSFSNSTNKKDTFALHHEVSSSKNDNPSNSSQLIIEENENENEVDYDHIHFSIRFFKDLTSVKPNLASLPFYNGFAPKTNKLIYKEVRNFRI